MASASDETTIIPEELHTALSQAINAIEPLNGLFIHNSSVIQNLTDDEGQTQPQTADENNDVEKGDEATDSQPTVLTVQVQRSAIVKYGGEQAYSELCDMLENWQKLWALPSFMDNFVYVNDLRLLKDDPSAAHHFFFHFPGVYHGTRLNLYNCWKAWVGAMPSPSNNTANQMPINSNETANAANDEQLPPAKKFKLDLDGEDAMDIKSVTSMPRLTDILNSTETGKQFFEFHKNQPSKWFPEGMRNKLMNEIVSYFIRNGLKMSSSAASAYADQIAAAFPAESAEAYHCYGNPAHPKKLTKGIYINFQNAQRTCKKVRANSYSYIILSNFAIQFSLINSNRASIIGFAIK